MDHLQFHSRATISFMNIFKRTISKVNIVLKNLKILPPSEILDNFNHKRLV